MAQQDTQAAGSGQTIKVSDLKFALAAHRLRRFTGGGTCQVAAITAGTLIEVDCSSAGRLRLRTDALRLGKSRVTVTPMTRGHIGDLIERTRVCHGLAEVRKTWGAGIKALLAEPRYVLNGGAA